MSAELIDQGKNSLYKSIVPTDPESRIKIMRMCPSCLYFIKVCTGTGENTNARLIHILKESEIKKFRRLAPCVKI